jgi:hypothetical protein
MLEFQKSSNSTDNRSVIFVTGVAEVATSKSGLLDLLDLIQMRLVTKSSRPGFYE